MARKPTVDPELDDDFSDVPPATADDRTTETKQRAASSGPGARRQENQKSGQTSGNPENQNSGNPDDYLDSAYGGITDPYDDFTKGSTQLPLCVWRTLKAAAPVEGVSVQQLLANIVLGTTKPLPESHPDLLQRFYNMAKHGKLKR